MKRHRALRAATIVALLLGATTTSALAAFHATVVQSGSVIRTRSLAPPTAVTVVRADATTVVVSWTTPAAVHQGSGTEVLRGQGGGAASLLGQAAPGTATTFKDGDAPQTSVPYCYGLRTVLVNWSSALTPPLCESP